MILLPTGVLLRYSSLLFRETAADATSVQIELHCGNAAIVNHAASDIWALGTIFSSLMVRAAPGMLPLNERTTVL